MRELINIDVFEKSQILSFIFIACKTLLIFSYEDEKNNSIFKAMTTYYKSGVANVPL